MAGTPFRFRTRARGFRACNALRPALFSEAKFGGSVSPPIRLSEGGLTAALAHLTLDCALAQPLADGGAARDLEAAMRSIPGVVDTGLFPGTAERVLVGDPAGLEVLRRGG